MAVTITSSSTETLFNTPDGLFQIEGSVGSLYDSYSMQATGVTKFYYGSPGPNIANAIYDVDDVATTGGPSFYGSVDYTSQRIVLSPGTTSSIDLSFNGVLVHSTIEILATYWTSANVLTDIFGTTLFVVYRTDSNNTITRPATSYTNTYASNANLDTGNITVSTTGAITFAARTGAAVGSKTVYTIFNELHYI
jgi:hypothetical protein